MEVRWIDVEHPDQVDLAGAVAVREAARVVDFPQRLSFTTGEFLAGMRYGWDEEPYLSAVARLRPGGPVVAVLTVHLPEWDNTHLGSVDVVVDPAYRRQGLGRALFDVGVAKVRAAGRRLLLSTTVKDSPGVEFLAAMGMRPAYLEAYRRLELASADWAQLDVEHRRAQERATAYELVRVPTPSPESMLPQLAVVTGAINDAPTGELDIEDEKYSEERVRAYERAQLHRYRLYRVVARERSSGQLAGHTVMVVDVERPWYADQHDTSVLQAHRGHRLGLLLKIEMLRWLAEAEPQVRIVDTANAADNQHMIAINERLGFRLLRYTQEWQRDLT
jgi:GNAT superfamily N-acetyltransferase